MKYFVSPPPELGRLGDGKQTVSYVQSRVFFITLFRVPLDHIGLPGLGSHLLCPGSRFSGMPTADTLNTLY